MDEALAKWDELSTDQQQTVYLDSNIQAQNMLDKQKQKTGVAILGHPQRVLDTDPKFQGDIKSDCIKAGEQLALASLTAELLILKLANISKVQKYI